MIFEEEINVKIEVPVELSEEWKTSEWDRRDFFEKDLSLVEHIIMVANNIDRRLHTRRILSSVTPV